MYDWEWEEYLLFVSHLSADSKAGDGILAEDEMHNWNDKQWEQRQRFFESTPVMEQVNA